jgi:cytidine deaminase
MTETLIQLAALARQKAYAPYSGYQVGAALLDGAGNVWTGCNVENVSYGVSICAERTAVAKMVSEGCREVRAIAVATRDGGMPCGLCLQTLLEFAGDPSSVEVQTVSENGDIAKFVLSDLIPHGFRSSDFGRT